MDSNGNPAFQPWDQRLARCVVEPLARTGVHPNHLTSLSLGFGLGAAWVFAVGGMQHAGLAAALFMAAVFTDHTDGELARLTGKASTFGHRYDFVVGCVNYTLMYFTTGLCLAHAFGSHWPLLLGAAAAAANPIILTLRMRLDAHHGDAAVRHPARGGIELEDFIYLIGPFTWTLGLAWFFVPFALGALGYLGWTVLEYRRWQRR